MLIDTGVSLTESLQAAEAAAIAAEADGFDGISVPETRHDPFISLALTARHEHYHAALGDCRRLRAQPDDGRGSCQ